MTFIKFLEQYEGELKEKIEPRGIVITVSGLAGSGKTEVAKWLANKLKLKYHFAGKIFREIAKQRKLSLEEFSRTREANIDYRIEKESLKKILEGNILIDARLAGWVAGEHAKYRIFVFCPLELRAKRVAARDNISFKNAIKKISERDSNDRKQYLKLYGIDIFNKKIYNIILDNSRSKEELRKKLEEIVNKIKSD